MITSMEEFSRRFPYLGFPLGLEALDAQDAGRDAAIAFADRLREQAIRTEHYTQDLRALADALSKPEDVT